MGSWVYLHELCKYTFFLHNASVFLLLFLFERFNVLYSHLDLYINNVL